MDEPLAALDEGRKAEILPYIERLRDEAGLPIVYVSHAVSEVARLARTVVVLEAGRVAAVGAADTVLRRADLLATQEAEAGAILDMIVEETDSETGLTRLSGRVGRLWVPRLLRSIGTAVRIRVPARDVLLATQAPVGLSARNILEGHVVSIHAFGEAAAMVQIDCHGVLLAARLTRASVRDLALAPGRAVYAVVKSIAFDPQGVGTAGPAPVEI